MSKLGMYMAVASMYLGSVSEAPQRGNPIKPCLTCGKEHKHNNSFCSAECCKAYRKKK